MSYVAFYLSYYLKPLLISFEERIQLQQHSFLKLLPITDNLHYYCSSNWVTKKQNSCIFLQIIITFYFCSQYISFVLSLTTAV